MTAICKPDMWDNNMKVKSDEIDNNTFEQISLDKNLQTAKEIEKTETNVNLKSTNQVLRTLSIVPSMGILMPLTVTLLW